MTNEIPDTVRLAIEREEIAKLEDGYSYWFPHMEAVRHTSGGTTGGGGALSAHELRAIADELDRRNSSWDATIQNDPRIGGNPQRNVYSVVMNRINSLMVLDPEKETPEGVELLLLVSVAEFYERAFMKEPVT